MNIHEALEFYDRMGLCVIPIRPRGKEPLGFGPGELLTYHKRRSTPLEWEMWWPHGVPDDQQANIAVVTGTVSSVLVIDCDDPDTYHAIITADPALERTMTVSTGKGFHIYVKPVPAEVRTTSFRLNGGVHHIKAGTSQGSAGYVVAPPSIHPSGRRYQFANSRGLSSYSMDDLAQVLLTIGAEESRPQAKDRPENWADALYDGTFGIGERNERLTELGGLLRHYFPESRWGLAYAILKDWNATHCDPPLPEHEVERTIYSVSRYAPGSTPGRQRHDR